MKKRFNPFYIPTLEDHRQRDLLQAEYELYAALLELEHVQARIDLYKTRIARLQNAQ